MFNGTLRRTFKRAKGKSWTILDRDVVDEIIFKTENSRNRLMLELMARGGMKIGEVLKLKAKNVHGRKLILSDPKSGNQTEMVFIPKKVFTKICLINQADPMKVTDHQLIICIDAMPVISMALILIQLQYIVHEG